MEQHGEGCGGTWDNFKQRGLRRKRSGIRLSRAWRRVRQLGISVGMIQLIQTCTENYSSDLGIYQNILLYGRMCH